MDQKRRSLLRQLQSQAIDNSLQINNQHHRSLTTLNPNQNTMSQPLSIVLAFWNIVIYVAVVIGDQIQ